nr:hypothetical protein [Tanacetum cinerariifolium]
TLLSQIRAEIREEFRTSSGPSDAGGNPPPITIHTWLERFNKQKPHSFEKAPAPVDAENWISHMEKIFDVMGCEDAFKTRLAVYKFEGNALAWWKAYKQAKDVDAWLITMTWADFKKSKNFHRLDHEFHLAHSVEFFDDHPQQLGRSLLVSRPNRLYARARSEDGRLFHTPLIPPKQKMNPSLNPNTDQWEESLDIDDSDLRPTPVLRPCNNHHKRRHTTQTQTLISSQNSNSDNSAEKPVRIIPGPAGIIQAAKLRKIADIREGDEECVMATQDYIRKVVEDPEEDEDFKRGPWVVAVIKSATPNALGDMTVTLKDPKGTISGTIHHKVLTEAEFGKGICAGSALILHNVSVFSPKPSAHYLNITKRNLVKVFYKDGGSSQKQTLIVDTAPGSGRGTQMSGCAFSLERGAEGFSDAIRRNTDNNNQSMHIDDEQENVNPVSSIGQQCSKASNEGTNQNILTDEEMLTIADAIENSENVTRPTDGIKNGQPTVSASLPLWTDEQLDELLDADFDDLP